MILLSSEIVLFVVSFVLVSASFASASKLVPLSDTRPTRLDLSSSPEVSGNCRSVPAFDATMAFRCAGFYSSGGYVEWKVMSEKGGSFDLHLSYASLIQGDKQDLKVEVGIVGGKQAIADIKDKTKGNFLPGFDFKDVKDEYLWNYDRIPLDGKLIIEAGQEVHLRLSTDGMKKKQVIEMRNLELIPSDAVDALLNEASLAKSNRSDASWMHENGMYGLMVHFTMETMNDPASSTVSYWDAINSFDVEKFADMCAKYKFGYVIFTTNHQYPHMPAPIAEWEVLHPGWTTERDLIGEIAEALEARGGIRLILYLASHLVGCPGGDPKSPTNMCKDTQWLQSHEWDPSGSLDPRSPTLLVADNAKILRALGNRYGCKVAGFWLDGWDLIPESYPEVDFSSVYDSAKAGYSDRIVAYNRWIFPTISAFQDYWAGEIDSPEKIDIGPNGLGKYPPGFGMTFHSLIAFEEDWVYTGSSEKKPRYSAEEIIEYIEDVRWDGGCVTVNVALRQDGTFTPKQVKVFEKVAKSFDSRPPTPALDCKAESSTPTATNAPSMSQTPTESPSIISCENDLSWQYKNSASQNCDWVADKWEMLGF